MLFATCAMLIIMAGWFLARHTERISEKPPGNQVEDSFSQVARRIDELETIWQKTIDEEALRLLKTDGQADEIQVSGITQFSRLKPNRSESIHYRDDGGLVKLKPVFSRHAQKESDEWIFPEDKFLSGSGWIEEPGRPLAWWRGDERSTVILLLDQKAASEVVAKDLKERFGQNSLTADRGYFSWLGPSNTLWMEIGNKSQQTRPDEVFRHVSRFGDWTLQRSYPVRVQTKYRAEVLMAAFTSAVLLLGIGIPIAWHQRKATQRAEQRVTFVNQVSHELRTPLTNLLLNTDLALDSLTIDEGKVRRRLGLIREETSRLSRIVDNVQTFARMEQGKSVMQKSVCDLEKVLQELRENFAPLFKRKSITCHYHCEALSNIYLDSDGFAQILSNLLSNVEKYAGESAQAQVSIFREANSLITEVEDNGPGISPAAKPRIFLPFERADSRVSEGVSGTGLGLAISRDLAEQMGGKLQLLPTREGAKFRLTLPLGSILI